MEFNPNMKMAALVEADYHLLPVLERLGVTESFAEMTVGEMCDRNGLDTDTFVLICSVYSSEEYRPAFGLLKKGHITDVLRYLHKSHEHYSNNALVDLAGSIEELIAPCPLPQQKVIWKFFSDYKLELDRHFDFEERHVIPYVQSLLVGKRREDFTIDNLEKMHTDVGEKLSDLKNLVMKSLPPECDPSRRISLLHLIFELQMDLSRHTRIEDSVLVPMVRLIENPRSVAPAYESGPADGLETDAGELSGREKEILVCVARGMMNKEIADRHNISVSTVITHRKNITRKTGIRTVAGLTVYAILNGLIDINAIEL